MPFFPALLSNKTYWEPCSVILSQKSCLSISKANHTLKCVNDPLNWAERQGIKPIWPVVTNISAVTSSLQWLRFPHVQTGFLLTIMHSSLIHHLLVIVLWQWRREGCSMPNIAWLASLINRTKLCDERVILSGAIPSENVVKRSILYCSSRSIHHEHTILKL